MSYPNKIKNTILYNRFLERKENEIRNLFEDHKISMTPFCTLDNYIRYRNNIDMNVEFNTNRFIFGVQKKSFIKMSKLNIDHPLINFKDILTKYKDYDIHTVIPIDNLIYASNNIIKITQYFENILNNHVNLLPKDIINGFQVRETLNNDQYFTIVIKLQLFNEDYFHIWASIEDQIVDKMISVFSENLILASIYKQITNNKKKPTNKDPYYLIYKKCNLIQKIEKLKFSISPGAFFQVNIRTATYMYKKIRELYINKIKELGIDIKKVCIFDICCGIGTIGLFLSDYANKVIGFEINKNAISDCIENSKINQKNNTKYIQGPVEDTIHQTINILEDTNYLIPIVNPPKRGLYEPVLEILNKYSNKVEFFIYVSCNPKSFYKDYKKLENNFVISKIILLDQFPLTNDSEIIVLLEKKNI